MAAGQPISTLPWAVIRGKLADGTPTVEGVAQIISLDTPAGYGNSIFPSYYVRFGDGSNAVRPVRPEDRFATESEAETEMQRQRLSLNLGS